MTSPDTRRLNLLPVTLAAAMALTPMLANAQADGTPGNPASTAIGRTIDRATGTPTIPDGAPGNPPGTALGRAVDRATGTPTTPDGTPGNPAGTVVDRAANRAATAVQSATPAPTVAPTAAPTAAPNVARTATPTAAPTLAPPAGMTPGAAAIARPRLSQLIGGHVYNDRNERIGEVDEILLSAPGGLASNSGTGPTAIIQVGGFLGMGGRLVTLPLGDLRWNAEREHIVMPGATKESLAARPAFEYVMLRAR
ncbi:PRC-barrel domain-containing protein [Sediminicoccus sp. KRV36]|uniref:PRC-barrel domain-containing protein n=1 Tax=Sediminicoccus sp. KRV36 TaxID=3133721 RepID=UPI00200D0C6C|nr:PRC-barrel domain-containing protein [Sediminicoccus rosea]UPY36520.1 PRC-barrel domain-containing protein [Sediminicoccus rosea]